MCISDKLFKFSVYELLKFRHISRINTRYCVVHVAIITINYYCFHLSNLYIHFLNYIYIFISTCFSEHLKVDAVFIKQPNYFFLGVFLFKASPKKVRTFILTSMTRGNSIIAFHHVFMITFYAVTLQKLFFTDKT